MLPVKFSDLAFETFNLIREQVFNRWGINVAAEFEDRVLNFAIRIENDPYLFQAMDRDPLIRKGFVHRNCAVFYEIKIDHIEILFFWDNRQDPIF